MDPNYLYLFVAGAIAFTISTLSGGGGALLLLPTVNWLIGISGTAPVVNLGNLIGRPVRLVLFWKDIDWKVTLYYVPSALAGALLGAWLFSSLRLDWLQIILAVFLISTIFQYGFGKKKRSFPMSLWIFAPLGFAISFVSTLVGATGAVLNPFYLNYGLEKEKLIATKTANSFFVGVVQISSYTFFNLLHGELWWYGIALGLGMALGNFFGKKFLGSMSSILFRRLVIAMMVISGIVMLVRQLF